MAEDQEEDPWIHTHTMREMSYLEVALELVFPSFEWCVYVQERPCVQNSAALAKGNWEIHWALAKGK